MIDALARLLGIRPDQTEDALRSERAARATLNRRGFLLAGATAGAAIATGALWSIPPAAPPLITCGDYRATITTFDALLKERYLNFGRGVESLLYAPSPFLSMLQRKPAVLQ